MQQPTGVEEEQSAGESRSASIRLDAKAEERNVEGAVEGTVHTGRETDQGGKEELETQNKSR